MCKVAVLSPLFHCTHVHSNPMWSSSEAKSLHVNPLLQNTCTWTGTCEPREAGWTEWLCACSPAPFDGFFFSSTKEESKRSKLWLLFDVLARPVELNFKGKLWVLLRCKDTFPLTPLIFQLGYSSVCQSSRSSAGGRTGRIGLIFLKRIKKITMCASNSTENTLGA